MCFGMMEVGSEKSGHTKKVLHAISVAVVTVVTGSDDDSSNDIVSPRQTSIYVKLRVRR